MPYFLGGLKIAGGLSLIGAIVAEFAAGTAGTGSGLAYRILEAGYRLTPWATAYVAYRHMEYVGGVSADVFTPGLELTWAPWATLRARYYYSKASDGGAPTRCVGESGVISSGCASSSAMSSRISASNSASLMTGSSST